MTGFFTSLGNRSSVLWSSVSSALVSLCSSDGDSSDTAKNWRKPFTANVDCSRWSEKTPTRTGSLRSRPLTEKSARSRNTIDNTDIPPSDATPTPTTSCRPPLPPTQTRQTQSNDQYSSRYTETAGPELLYRTREQLNMTRQYHTRTAPATVAGCTLTDFPEDPRSQLMSFSVTTEDPVFSQFLPEGVSAGPIELKRDMFSSHVSFSNFKLHTGHRVLGGILTMAPTSTAVSSTPMTGNRSCSVCPADVDEGSLIMYVQVNLDDKDEASAWGQSQRVMRVVRDVRLPGYRSQVEQSSMGGESSVTLDISLEDAETKAPSTLWDSKRPVTMTVGLDSACFGQVGAFGDVWMPALRTASSDGDNVVTTSVYGLTLGAHDLRGPWVKPVSATLR